MVPLHILAVFLLTSFALTRMSAAQTARITEERRALLTYPYYEPNPVPVLTKDSRLWPYHTFQSYVLHGEEREWTVVTLENDYIKVFVLPEVGGKVWGAVEKASGHEFIYRNEVLKFRNISLRGPWTSGGIEFNFGVIGHTPATASPVDYRLVENGDGSVSIFVGTMDLPSRTHWRVEIRLPADKAYFETNVLWTNPTSLEQPYYNWMTAAAFARGDLEVAIPGNQYLRHSGEVLAWPFDEEGRKLSSYSQNAFGPSKSYHVVGEYNDFFGGYYTEADYGFGHWAPYSDMPGQKLWLWALSRQGGIWEDLLTDTDGQYIEFQAGRLFVQYSPGSHVNPITQATFEPHASHQWKEIWFPVEGIGGLNDASERGAMFVDEDGSTLNIGINSFEDADVTVFVRQGGVDVHSRSYTATPLKAILERVEFNPDIEYEVVVPELDLHYTSDSSSRLLSRPFETSADAFPSLSGEDRLVFDGQELMKARRYEGAGKNFVAALEENRWNREALFGYAELLYRQALYSDGLEAIHRALQLGAYDAQANFIAGLHYRALFEFVNAKEAFGWAERSMAYRSAANVELAEIALHESDYEEAERRARRALDYDRYSAGANQILAIVARKTDNTGAADERLARLLQTDPLHHFAVVERYLWHATDENLDAVRALSRSEFPEQNFLELAVSYFNRGQHRDAIRVLELGEQVASSQMARLWLAYLYREADPQESLAWISRAGEFSTPGTPFRRESLRALTWITAEDGDWRWSYLLALNYWGIDRREAAAALMGKLGTLPEYAPFYVARAVLLAAIQGRDEESDLRLAIELDQYEPAIWLPLVQYYQRSKRWEEALELTGRFRKSYRGPFSMDVLHARSLLNLERPLDAISILENTQVLPSEGSAGGHAIHEQAHLMEGLGRLQADELSLAIEHFEKALSWPENLGAGRPHDPEDRLLRFVLAVAHARNGDVSKAEDAYRRVVDGTLARIGTSQFEHLLAYLAAVGLGDETAAQNLLMELSKSEHAGQLQTRWVIARAQGDEKTVAELEAIDPSVFKEARSQLLRRALEIVNRPIHIP